MSSRKPMDQREMTRAISRISAGSSLKIVFTDRPFRGASEATALRRILDACKPAGDFATIRNDRRTDMERALEDGVFVGNPTYFFDINRGGGHLIDDFRALVGNDLVLRVSKV